MASVSSSSAVYHQAHHHKHETSDKRDELITVDTNFSMGLRKCWNNIKLLTPQKSDAIHHLYWEESKAPDIGPPEYFSSRATADKTGKQLLTE